MAKTEDHHAKRSIPHAMKIRFPFSVNVRFPGDLEYIPAVRKFVAELLQVSNFSSKFAYRSEIIVDEICNNAVAYGCRTDDAQIDLLNTIFDDRIEFTIRDEGGTKDNVRRLKTAAKTTGRGKKEQTQQGLGLEVTVIPSKFLDLPLTASAIT